MKVPRNLTLLVHFVFDQLIPPLLRDSRWFMWLPFKMLFGDKTECFFSFKEKALLMSEEEFRNIYLKTASVHIQRETDLNQACIEVIEARILGNSVLDISCGRGFLSKRLAQSYRVTAADIVIDEQLRLDNPKINFQEASVEHLPFPNQAFDTVICTHTLEHVQNLRLAIKELRRVAAKQLIIVVPKQRPYKYTFDLHLHFFPYEHSLLKQLDISDQNFTCQNMGGDWMYVENFDN